MSRLYRFLAILLLTCCIFPAQAFVWFADDQSAYQVDTGTNSITRNILLDKTQGLAVDSLDSSLWAITSQKLLKFDSSGNLLLQIDLQSSGLIQPRHLATDPYDSSLWIADEKTFAHFNSQGQLLGVWQASGSIRAIALSSDQSLWLLGNKQLAHYSAQGALLVNQDLHGLVTAEPKFLAVDSSSNRLWLAGEKQLVQFNTGNLSQTLLNITLPAVTLGVALDTNSGTLWLMTKQSLIAYTRDGVWLKTVDLTTLAIKEPQRLAYDPMSLSLWLGHKAGLSRLTTDGTLIITFPTAKAVQAIGVSPLMVTSTPTLTLVQPPQDALSNNPKPTIILGYGATCSGQPCGYTPSYFSNYSLSALLNNNPVGNLFVFDPLTGQTSYTPTSPLPEGANPFAAQATDSLGRLSNNIDTTFTIDTIPPVITLTSIPAALTNQPQQTLTGSLSEPATLLVNGQITSVTADYHFNTTLTLAEGINTLELTAIDTAGNNTYLTLTVTLDTVAPTAPNASLIQTSIPASGQTTLTATAGAVEAGAIVAITNLATNLTITITAAADGAFSAQIGASGGDELSIVASDPVGNQSAATKITVISSGGGGGDPGTIPPDPATVAPPVDQTVASNLLTTTEFLYSGSNPIQQGVASGTIEAKRVAVLRGNVLTRDNQPLSGVRITIHGHPEFGYTSTRTDGMFDIAVNGGGPPSHCRFFSPGSPC